MAAPRPFGEGVDQYVALEVVVQPADTPEAESLYRRMAESMAFDPRLEFPT